MPFQLIITNIIIVFCTVLTFGLGLFSLLKGAKKGAAVAFFLLSLAVDIFYLSHFFGINAPNATLAWYAFMFNLINIPIVCLNYHFIYEVFGTKTPGRKRFLILSYATGFVLLGFYLLYPDTFLTTPVPKMYLPFYYEPGSLYWLMRAYFILVSGYVLYDLIKIYLAANYVEKNRVKYIFIGLAYGYFFGSLAVLLVYDINVDPLYAMLFGLYTIPFLYCFLQYNLLDVRILARRALLYAIAMVSLGIAIVLLNATNDYVIRTFPEFPFWLLPFISACIVVGAGGFVWSKISEVDKLKYEFVTVVTHKFRTPLTYITWSLDTLLKGNLDESGKNAVHTIKAATERLAELTDLLIGLGKIESSEFEYQLLPQDIIPIIKEVLDGEATNVKEKEQILTLNLPPEPVIVVADKRRLEFALQILVENAISYTPRGGRLTIGLKSEHNACMFSVTDSGIGISSEELPFLFSKFFRGKQARLTDTEGMGIGLYIAQQIAHKQGGTIEATSEGERKGSTFSVKLPLAKKSSSI
jgi:signal transduction histidine kinase